jgi:hypothetical protein
MPLSLHAATIPTALQILGSVAALIDKAEAHCGQQGLAPAALVEARLAPDMKPFAYQISSCAWHCAQAIAGVRAGLFAPDFAPPPTDFAGLRDCIARARDVLLAVTEAEMESFIGKPMRFEVGDFRLDFLAEEFLLSFSQPNFHFHATTAYDILRAQGLPVGKLDYLGNMRVVAK